MIITDIKKGKRGYSILFCDGEYCMKIRTDVLLKYDLHVGFNVDMEHLENIKKQSECCEAQEKALNLLTYRDRSKKELKYKITRDINENAADFAVKKMELLGLIDDVKFAKQYAHELFFKKRLSIAFVRNKLREKGIDNYTIESIINEYDVNEEEQVLFLLKNKFSGKMNNRKEINRVIGALSRLGYEWSTMKSAVARYNEETTEDELK